MPTVTAGARVAGLVLLTFLVARPAAADELRVDSVAITVSDMGRVLPFYTEVLPFEVVADHEQAGPAIAHLVGVFGARTRTVRLRLGTEAIELVDYLAPEGRPIPPDSHSNDLWFQHVALIVSDMDAAYRLLREHDVAHTSSSPQTLPAWNPDAGGIKAFYFKDPDGHNLEILQFPPGKGDPRWQAKDRLFLGIDHTAIAVDDTERSLAFWQGVLGFQVAGRSENYGPEQEELNNVFGARLQITGLKAPGGGIGVEFLDYLSPGTGRPASVDALSNDLWHWHVSLDAGDPGLLMQRVRDARHDWVSPGLVTGLDAAAGPAEAGMVRDPDRHAVLIGARP
jgi:catechol 2,3-dioxygenase-like lactoylglutathione lyase family enzyme